MKFKIEVKKVGEDGTWWEEYDLNIDNPQQWAEDTVEMFNSNLHLGERKRTLLKVETIDENSREKHTWIKTNNVTIIKGTTAMDTYICEVCGITSKRFGLSGTYTFDSKYKAQVYHRCDTAKKWIDKKKNL